MGTEAKAFATRLVEAMLTKGLVAQRAKSGVDVKPLKAVAGVSHEMARRYTEGLAMPGAEKVRAIAEWLGVSVGWLRDGSEPPQATAPLREQQAAGEFIMVPRYDMGGADGQFRLQSELIVDYLAFRPEWLRQVLNIHHDEVLLLTVRGDAMAPVLHPNDLVLVDTQANRIEDNAIYALNVHGAPVIKRVQRRFNGDYVVKCDNPAYDQEHIAADEAAGLEVIGRVVWTGRQL